MITQKMKYALKALTELAVEKAGAGAPLSIEEIARRSGTPKRFLEQILLEIRKAGIVASTRGRTGGYVLLREAQTISLSELLRLIDGPIAPLQCLSQRAYQRCEDCEDEATCKLRRVFSELFWSYLMLMESLTLADLAANPKMAAVVGPEGLEPPTKAL